MYEKARKFAKAQALLMGLALMAALFPASGFGQQKPFEGLVKATETMLSDTVHYFFYAKGEKVRVEVYDKFMEPRSVYLVDFQQQTITAMDPEKRIYHPRSTAAGDARAPVGFSVDRVFENRRNFFTGSAWQCIVEMPNGQGRLQYWMVEGQYYFFKRLFAVWGSSEYFQAMNSIAGIEGHIPMEITNRSPTFVTRSTFRVTEVSPSLPAESLFVVPAGYTRQ